MCYEVVSATRAKLKYAQQRANTPQDITELENLLKTLEKDLIPYYHISGFKHPNILVFKDTEPLKPQVLQWGLIPNWAKNETEAQTIKSKTLNARIETLSEKASYKNIITNTCLIMVDAFFEHKLVGKNKYPHLIQSHNAEPLCLAGLYDVWQDVQNNIAIETVTIITIPANNFMANIHNNAKMGEARMPLLLDKNLQDNWLSERKLKSNTKHWIAEAQKLELQAHTVQKLSGKRALGNVSKVIEKHTYPELEMVQGSLF